MADFSFKKIDNKKQKKNNSILLYILIVVSIVVAILLYFVLSSKPKTKEKENIVYVAKKDKNKDYVYTVKKEENKTQEEEINKVPAINIDTKEVADINEKILTIYNKVKEKEEYDYKYQYNKSNSILSLLIAYSYHPEPETYPITFYNSYNIDLETGKVITPNELLDRYEITPAQLKDFIKSKLQKYYKDLIDKKYYTKEECNYSCFLRNRGLSPDYLKGVSLYVDKNKLTAFKFFYKESSYNEEKYFDNISYQIEIKRGD